MPSQGPQTSDMKGDSDFDFDFEMEMEMEMKMEMESVGSKMSG